MLEHAGGVLKQKIAADKRINRQGVDWNSWGSGRGVTSGGRRNRVKGHGYTDIVTNGTMGQILVAVASGVATGHVGGWSAERQSGRWCGFVVH